MLEALAAALVTALLSTGSAAALHAARRAGETRDAVLLLTTKVDTFDKLLIQQWSDARALTLRVDSHELKISNLDTRVESLEITTVDPRTGCALRHPPPNP